MEKFKNAAQFPKRYFGLHMVEGLAEYRPPGKNPFRVLVREEAIRKMDPTFEGKPVYVGHVDDVDVDQIGKANERGEVEEAGYVIRSFFNEADGRHWAEFLVISDKGHEAIRSGWKLSNCYISSKPLGGGQWHNVDYEKEVTEAEYEHLAIVRVPRYEESIILTPEQFKEYNEKHLAELKRIANSKENEKQKKEKKPMKFQFWKKEKFENQADLASTMVELKGVGSISIEDALSQLEKFSNGYHCNGDETVTVGDKKMLVNELVSSHIELVGKNQADEEMKKKNADEADKAAKAAEAKKEGELNPKNEDSEGEDMENKKKNADEEEKKKENEKKESEEKEKSANSKEAEENFLKVKNAMETAKKNNTHFGEMAQTEVQRGQSRYGSKK